MHAGEGKTDHAALEPPSAALSNPALTGLLPPLLPPCLIAMPRRASPPFLAERRARHIAAVAAAAAAATIIVATTILVATAILVAAALSIYLALPLPLL